MPGDGIYVSDVMYADRVIYAPPQARVIPGSLASLGPRNDRCGLWRRDIYVRCRHLCDDVIYARASQACKVAKTQGGSLPMLRRFAPALAGLAFALAAPAALAQANKD